MARLEDLGFTPEEAEEAESLARRLGEQLGISYSGDQLVSVFERMTLNMRDELRLELRLAAPLEDNTPDTLAPIMKRAARRHRLKQQNRP